ncbi:hypothetical protein Zmor_019914 [Zophobas morio]|uniref:Uncharacterized protein n=1 Tax=Zophobas morio TaxID=2755281 RepID=A0AA38I2F0_9CUCU|nr:hypothetical protein Zmor_019914 [Zophobas morio]
MRRSGGVRRAVNRHVEHVIVNGYSRAGRNMIVISETIGCMLHLITVPLTLYAKSIGFFVGTRKEVYSQDSNYRLPRWSFCEMGDGYGHGGGSFTGIIKRGTQSV